MATLDDLKLRIIADTGRDDLESDLADVLTRHIQDACEQYANIKFWFNSVIASVNTVSGQNYVAIPATVRVVERVTIPATQTELREVALMDLSEGTGNSSPTHYAYYNDQLRLYPTPGAVYSLNIYGIAQVAAPAEGTDSSIWTNQAARLIAAHTAMTLYRDVWRDDEGFMRAKGALQDVYGRMTSETARRLRVPMSMPSGTPWGRDTFDVITG